jgi:hypothetical protein
MASRRWCLRAGRSSPAAATDGWCEGRGLSLLERESPGGGEGDPKGMGVRDDGYRDYFKGSVKSIKRL